MAHLLRMTLLFTLVVATTFADETPARHRTPIVHAIRQVQPAVAAIYVRKGNERGAGSGSVIDPRGYVLTAKHVVGDEHVVLLAGRPPLRADLIGTMPEFDLAVLKLGDQAIHRPASPTYPLSGTPPAFIRLGLPHEVMLGESILNIGSPGGRGIVVTRGIVSAVGISGGNALSLATQASNGFNSVLQFDAASNPGNSGGPLINVDGQQIGLVTSSIRSEEGIHFAVPLETIRDSLKQMLNAEMRHRYVTGLTVDPHSAAVNVVSVAAASPAEASDVRIGDVIISVDSRKLRDPVDWEFTRFELRPGQKIQLGLMRGDTKLSAALTLAPRTSQVAVQVADRLPGLLCRSAIYDPRLADPLNDDQQPSGVPVIIPNVTATPHDLPRDEHYELLIEGLLQIKEAGLYRLALKSDDGARLFVHDQLILDNGGNHAEQFRTGWVDLEAGLHPLRIDYYEDQGHGLLEFLIAKGDSVLRPVTAEELWHAKASD